MGMDFKWSTWETWNSLLLVKQSLQMPHICQSLKIPFAFRRPVLFESDSGRVILDIGFFIAISNIMHILAWELRLKWAIPQICHHHRPISQRVETSCHRLMKTSTLAQALQYISNLSMLAFWYAARYGWLLELPKHGFFIRLLSKQNNLVILELVYWIKYYQRLLSHEPKQFYHFFSFEHLTRLFSAEQTFKLRSLGIFFMIRFCRIFRFSSQSHIFTVVLIFSSVILDWKWWTDCDCDSKLFIWTFRWRIDVVIPSPSISVQLLNLLKTRNVNKAVLFRDFGGFYFYQRYCRFERSILQRWQIIQSVFSRNP